MPNPGSCHSCSKYWSKVCCRLCVTPWLDRLGSAWLVLSEGKRDGGGRRLDHQGQAPGRLQESGWGGHSVSIQSSEGALPWLTGDGAQVWVAVTTRGFLQSPPRSAQLDCPVQWYSCTFLSLQTGPGQREAGGAPFPRWLWTPVGS